MTQLYTVGYTLLLESSPVHPNHAQNDINTSKTVTPVFCLTGNGLVFGPIRLETTLHVTLS